jgi:hypothetical protein
MMPAVSETRTILIEDASMPRSEEVCRHFQSTEIQKCPNARRSPACRKSHTAAIVLMCRASVVS